MDLDKYIQECYTLKTSRVLKIRKFNKNNQLCYFDSKDLTFVTSKKKIKIFKKLFERAGFQVEIEEKTYYGIYDPSRVPELIKLYPTDKQLLEQELREKS